MDPWIAHGLYAAAWASFGLGHSLLAGPRLRRLFGRGYRLAYNLVGLVHFVAVISVGVALLHRRPDFGFPAWLEAAMAAVSLAGAVLLVWFLRWYDLGRFAGTAQLRDPATDARPEPLSTTGPHAYVRHPLYAAAFLLVWGRAVDPLHLATAVWASLYLIVGSRFEERRLIALYGAAYREYRRRVPAFVPWKGRAGA